MPKHPITGDVGSTRRPRAMDMPRRAAWAAAFKKLNAGLKVWEMPAEEHAALLRPGLFEGLDEVAAHEEAAYVVRYWLHGFDRSLIPPRGPTIAASGTPSSRNSGLSGISQRYLGAFRSFSWVT